MGSNVSNIQITPIRNYNGLLAFASFILDNNFYMGSIGVHTRPNGALRLVYPTRKVANDNLPVYYPINKEIAGAVEQAIIAKFENIASTRELQN